MVKYLTILLVCVTCFAQDRVPGPRSLLYIPKFSQGTGVQYGDGNGGFVEGSSTASSSVGFSAQTLATNPAAYSVTNVYMTNMAAGIVDFWTVPSGYRASACGGLLSLATNSGGASTALAIKRDSVYYMIQDAAAIATSIVTSVTSGFNNFVLEPGDTVAYTNSAAGIYARVSFRYWSTNLLFQPKTSTLFSATNGITNLLYTCPAGKRASLASNPSMFGSSVFFVAKHPVAGLRNQVFVVPNGATPSEEFLIYDRTLANAAATSVSISELGPGDSIYVSVFATNANQNFWVSYGEYPQ